LLYATLKIDYYSIGLEGLFKKNECSISMNQVIFPRKNFDLLWSNKLIFEDEKPPRINFYAQKIDIPTEKK